MTFTDLVLNVEKRQFEYMVDAPNFIAADDGFTIRACMKEKLEVKAIIEEAIKNWNENNPTLKLKSD